MIYQGSQNPKKPWPILDRAHAMAKLRGRPSQGRRAGAPWTCGHGVPWVPAAPLGTNRTSQKPAMETLVNHWFLLVFWVFLLFLVTNPWLLTMVSNHGY